MVQVWGRQNDDGAVATLRLGVKKETVLLGTLFLARIVAGAKRSR